MNVVQAVVNLAMRQQRRLAGRARWTTKVGSEGVKDAMHATRRSGEGVRDAAINAGKAALRRIRRPVRAMTRRRHQLQEQWGFNQTEWGIEREIEQLVARDRPIVLGPWLSEVGFETLYWVPFLHWVKAAFKLDPGRLVAVSRGGVHGWYDGLASRYVEIWDDLDPVEFARRNAERGATKQYEPSALDAHVLDNVARRLGTRDFDVLHPGLMYRLFTLYWSGQRAMGFLDAHLRFTRAVAPAVIDPALLPRDYIAVKLYAARSLPDSPEMRGWLRSMVAGLSQQAPVVLLDTGLVLEDDHGDYLFTPAGGAHSVISARSWMTPQNNLGAQTQIVAGARAFVGTCGSIAWLAPRLGVDTSALFVDPKWLHAHLAVAMRGYHRLGAGQFAAADLRALHVMPPPDRERRLMKLLFIARHQTYFRNYDSAIRELVARGHRIHLAVEREDQISGAAAVAALLRDCPAAVTVGPVPARRVDTWSGAARRLRLGLDYLRYLEPFYDTATLRRVRARDRTPRLLIAFAEPPLIGGPRWRRLAARLLHACDRAVPPPQSIVEFIRDQQPDALLITPLVDLGSQQIDYVRAARLLGIPTGLAVWSWDHLTSKAYLREAPERVLVWNPTQRHEAVDVHGVPPERVVVTGAQCFDHWFDRVPSRSREAFCLQLGLPADRPLILYVGTGLIKGSPPEPPFVEEWLQWLRGSGDPLLQNAGVLIRPHPSKTGGWQEIDWRRYGDVVVWGANPVDERSRTDYFDSLYHSAAVIGLNTSAFIEAGIVGRDVLTIMVPRFHDNQEGTAHFTYLLQIGGGLLRPSRDRESHLTQLGEALRRPVSAGHPHRAFIESFVRPRGIDHAATPDFVAAVEELATTPVDVAETASGGWQRTLLGAAVRAASRLAGESLVRSPRELDPARQARIAAAVRDQPRKTG